MGRGDLAATEGPAEGFPRLTPPQVAVAQFDATGLLVPQAAGERYSVFASAEEAGRYAREKQEAGSPFQCRIYDEAGKVLRVVEAPGAAGGAAPPP